MPILIAHRGNLEGPSVEYENNPNYVSGGLFAYPSLHAEIDVWFQKGDFFLGHDDPRYKINEDFLVNARLWCHAKNLPAFERMLSNPLIHCFWHQEDDFVLTSRGYIWTYPEKKLTPKSICVMPELWKEVPNTFGVAGVCSDFISGDWGFSPGATKGEEAPND